MTTPPAPDDTTIVIVGPDDTTERAVDRSPGRRLRREGVSATELADQVSGFVGSMRTVLDRIPRFVGDFEIDQITVSAEVSAKGRLSLLGAGGELGGKGGLTFTFRKVGGEGAEPAAGPTDPDSDSDSDSENGDTE